MPSAILRTVSVQMLTLSCQARWSARFCAGGKEFVEGGAFDVFAFAAAGAFGAGIEILGEEGAEIEFVEGIGGFGFGDFFGFFLEERFVGVAVGGGRALFGDFFEDGIGHDFLIDHLAQLQAIEREHADHLHEARRENLLLGHAQAEFGCEPVHSNQFSRNPSPRYTRRTSGSFESSSGVPALKIFPSLMM